MVPQATWKRRTKRLSVEESERTERLARVLAAAEHVGDDRDQAGSGREATTVNSAAKARCRLRVLNLEREEWEDLLDKLFFGLPV